MATSSLTWSRLRWTHAADWRSPMNLSSGVTEGRLGNTRSPCQGVSFARRRDGLGGAPAANGQPGEHEFEQILRAIWRRAGSMSQ